MTQAHDTRGPKPCHYDRALGDRVTRDHRDDCPTTTHPDDLDQTCPGRDGCAPCTAHHCVLCRRAHATNDNPITCPDCTGIVRTDLEEIRWLCRHLRWQATLGGRDGRLDAAKPIPGGDAMVMLGPHGADLEDTRWHKTLHDDHPLDKNGRPVDPTPPLLTLLGWVHQWRRWQHLDDLVRPSLTGVIGYLTSNLTTLAQAADGPDWVQFARDLAQLRRKLEGVLHDEQDPEQGVPCFECGDRLVRKFGKPNACRHVAQARTNGVSVTHWVWLLSTYPELDDDHTRCHDQGGIADPSVGQSWECTGCRKQFSPGEYAHAVRQHLLISGPDGDGWTHITMAAEAAATMTGMSCAPGTVRKWMDRGKVSGLCRWTRGVSWGQRLVYWPDVADQAAAAAVRAHEADLARRRRAEREAS